MRYEIHNCEIVKETGRAVLVESKNLDEPTWVPMSVIHDDSEVWEEGDIGVLTVKSWWAEKEGLL